MYRAAGEDVTLTLLSDAVSVAEATHRFCVGRAEKLARDYEAAEWSVHDAHEHMVRMRKILGDYLEATRVEGL